MTHNSADPGSAKHAADRLRRTRTSPNATRIVITAGALNTFASLPRFLCGALAVLISDELGLSPRQIGAAISTVVAVSSLGSIWGGRIVQRIGAFRGMVLVATLSALVHLGIAVQATTYRALLGWMVLLSKRRGKPVDALLPKSAFPAPPCR